MHVDNDQLPQGLIDQGFCKLATSTAATGGLTISVAVIRSKKTD